jgi:glycosyltransferase involved in cell wall biosynthesis
MTSWVDLPGQLPRSEIRDVLGEADLYVAPAVLESFGIAALEARTVGLPVVGRTGSGVGEFVHDGVNGLVVSSDSEMAAAIASLATDPARVAEMRAWNVSHPPEQEWSQVARLAVSEYERAISLVRA